MRRSSGNDPYVPHRDRHAGKAPDSPGAGGDSCAAMGNGRNDLLMCRDAALSVAVIGPEGAHGRLLSDADVCVTSINDGLDLLLKPKRLIASLRG